MSEIAERLLDLINRNNATYGELSKQTGIPKSAIQRYATGETEKIPITRIELLAKALHSSAAYLMGWDESATPIPDDQEEIAKVALFGGDGEVTDDMWNEVKGFVEFIKDKRKRENDQH